MVIFGDDGQPEVRRQPLPGDWQGYYRDGTIYVDSRVPLWGVEEVVAQIQHKLIGNEHLAPNCEPYRPGRHLHLAHSDTTSGEVADRGVG